VTSRLNIAVPATLTVLGGNGTLSSLAGLGPGISISGAAPADMVTLQLVAGNTAATIGVANAGGATLSAQSNTLSLSGTQAQVNAALSGLELLEPADAAPDVLSLSATDTAALAAASALAVDVVPLTGPAFVAPPGSLALQPNTLSPVHGLLLADPIAAGLAAMGLGAEETLSLTLSVAAGVLLLPGFNALGGIDATGLGTGTIELSLTADEIGALNGLLGGLAFVGPAGGHDLHYALWNAAGVLPRVVTYGSVFLNATGTAAADGVLVAGAQTIITGGTIFTGTLAASNIETVLGTLAGGAIAVAPGAALQLPYDTMSLTGTSLMFGTLTAAQLDLAGAMLADGLARVAGGTTLAPGALLAFADGLTLFGTADNSLDVALSLAPGAVLQGDGTLMAGNFSQGAVLEGGTIVAWGGDTLEIDANLISGGAALAVAGGGVMVLGPVTPLYGVFDSTPLTIDNSVTLSFLGAGAQAVTGGYANPLGGAGGAFVLGGPQYFAGTVTGFGAGDALIFPDLREITLFNVGSLSFEMAGLDALGTIDHLTIFTSIAAGYVPAVGWDEQGDEEVYVRPPAPAMMQDGLIVAAAGVPQPLLGVSVVMPDAGTQSLSLTLSAARGVLSDNGGPAAPVLTLTAANIAALNNELAAVSYSGAGIADDVTFTGGSGPLAGVQGNVAIGAGSAGTISGYAGAGASEANVVSFGVVPGLTQVTAPLAVGGVLVNGLADFEGILSSATGLRADAGGTAVFGAAATVRLAGDVTLGDGFGAGTLVVLSDDVAVAGDVTLAAVAAGAGSAAAILGAMDIAGTLLVGAAGAAAVVAEGIVTAGALTLGQAGTLRLLGTAQVGCGAVSNSGTILVTEDAQFAASAYQGAGALDIGGTALLTVAGLAADTGSAPQITIGEGAGMVAGSVGFASGTFDDAGLLSVAGVAQIDDVLLAGGTLAAGSLAISGTMSGYGLIAAPVIAQSQLIEALGGRLLLNGNVSGTAPLEIAAGAVLEIGGSPGAAPISFAGTDAVAVLDDAAASGFSAVQMTAADGIDLVGIAPSLVRVPASGGGAGAILNGQGGTLSQFSISLAGTAANHIIVLPDGAGGSLLTVNGQLPCFARGTGILSPHGYRPVESLRPHDPVITANGERRPVRWIGWRTLDLGREAARGGRPVLILPHAFGPGKPARMLRLSPSHAVFAGGVLIPVMHLVNGATVLRDTAAQAATYFHIELDRHDVVLAEGLACESYFDDGNRAGLYQERGRRCPARRPYAPLVSSGARLAAVRRLLHERALAAGFAPRFQARLRAVAAGQSVFPEITRGRAGRVARFAFAAPVRELVLLCATACPADTDPDSEDRREVGICCGTMRGVQLGAGWQARAVGDAGSWMGARAELAWRRARLHINLPLAAVARSWHRAAVDAGRAGG
jgi:hypothetical protein